MTVLGDYNGFILQLFCFIDANPDADAAWEFFYVFLKRFFQVKVNANPDANTDAGVILVFNLDGLSDNLDVYDDSIKYTYRECTSSERWNFFV